MNRVKKEGWPFYLTMLAVAAMLSIVLSSTCRGDEFQDAIDATCRVKDREANGQQGTGTGFLYDVGPARSGDEDLAWILTAAHVISTGTDVRVEFGRHGVPMRVRVFWRNPHVDGGVLVVPYRSLPVPRPRPIRLAPPRVRVQVGQQLWSIGCPNGGPLMAWFGKCVGHEGGTILFAPGPELGRSGSPILADVGGNLRAVGILSARNSEGLKANTIGKAVGMADLFGQQTAWKPAQCPPGGCPSPQYQAVPPSPIQPYEILPYRHYQNERDRIQNERISGIERSQGTMPLPPAITVPVPSGPDPDVQKRITGLELEADIARRERAELTRRADVVKATAAELAEKYEKQLPGISADVNAAIEASNQAAKAASTAAGVADKADQKVAAVEGVAKAADGKAEEAKATAEETKGKLATFLAEGGGPIKQKIQERLEEKGMSSTAAGLVGALGGSAVIGIVIAVVIVLVRRGEKKAMAGEDTLMQRLADRTPWSWDDKAADLEARVLRRVGERLHPSWSQPAPQANPTQPQ